MRYNKEYGEETQEVGAGQGLAGSRAIGQLGELWQGPGLGRAISEGCLTKTG